MHRSLLLGLILALTVRSGVSSAAPMDPIVTDPVQSAAGSIAGTRLSEGKVRAYLGIPYAKPPVRELRWQPPQPIRWTGVWNADRFGPECIQVLRPHGINHYFGEEASSEDCLYLNIWTPANANASSHLPVVVFFYGGGGTVGSAGMAVYHGQQVAAQGAVFVSLNYRVGILGYMAHPALTREQGGHSGNYGYLDQVQALKWVQENIAAFGGDPSKVLISGQSFGAGSVAAQLFSPLSKGLYRAAAMWSACSIEANQVPLAEAEKIGADIEQRLNETSLTGLRDVPADRILALQEEHQLGSNVRGVRLPPTVDGYFWPMDKASTLKAHQLNPVPIIAGSNGDDIDWPRYPLTQSKTARDYAVKAHELYGEKADEFLKLYPVADDAALSAVTHLAAREAGFLAQSQDCARAMAEAAHQAAYIELFTRRPSFAPGATIADINTATAGAYHTADVPFWFGTLDAFNLFESRRQWTNADRALSADMTASLIAFANSGSPATSQVPWPAWSASKPRYLVFGEKIEVQSMREKPMAFLAAHPVGSRDGAIPGRTTRD